MLVTYQCRNMMMLQNKMYYRLTHVTSKDYVYDYDRVHFLHKFVLLLLKFTSLFTSLKNHKFAVQVWKFYFSLQNAKCLPLWIFFYNMNKKAILNIAQISLRNNRNSCYSIFHSTLQASFLRPTLETWIKLVFQQQHK